MNHGLARMAALAALAAGCPSSGDPDVPIAPTAMPTSAPVSVPEATSVELGTDVGPTAYRLQLTIDPRETSFTGRAEIDVDVARDTDTIVLHARDLSIDRAIVRVGGAELEPSMARRRAFGARTGEEELVLRLDKPVPRGPATLVFSYEAPFANLNGIYRVEHEGAWFAFTQMEPTDARRAFPSFDEPRHKTPFEVTLTVPSGMVAFANAREVAREPAGDLVRFRFARTEPIPTYLFALAVGPLETAAGPHASTPIRFVAPKGRAEKGGHTLDATAKTLKILEDYFGRPYPYDKLDIVGVPNFGPGAMENAGLVTFREELVVFEARAPAFLKRRMELIMAHELAHQWFGNLVTMRWWDDLWLNEGFATWMAPKTCDDAFPGFAGEAERVLDRAYAMNADVLPSARAVRPRVEQGDQIREAGGWSAYQKGASVLTMLEAWIGEEEFRDAIRDYVNANAWRSITSKELFASLDKAADKPVSKVAASFLDQPSLPLVKVEVACGDSPRFARGVDGKSEAAPAKVILQISDASGGERTWTVPVCVRLVGEKSPLCVVVDGPQAEIALPRCAAVFPNHEEAGYFRYELDPASAKRLMTVYGKLDERERAGWLLDAWALVLLGRAEPASVLGALELAAGERERSHIVIDAVVHVLYELDRHYVTSEHETKFGAYVRRLLAPHKKRLGMPKANEPDNVRIHRAMVFAALFDLAGDLAVAKELEPLAKAYLSDPASADPDLGPLAVRVSVRAGGAAATELDAARLAAAKSPSERVALVGAMASRSGEPGVREALDLYVSGAIRAGDWRHLRSAALRYRSGREQFHDYLMGRFDDLLARLGHAGAITSTIGAACDAAVLDRLTEYFAPKLASLEGAQRGFDEGVAEATRCIRVREKGAPRF